MGQLKAARHSTNLAASVRGGAALEAFGSPLLWPRCDDLALQLQQVLGSF